MSDESRAPRPSPTWEPAPGETPEPVAITPLGWLVFALRLPVLALVVFGGLGIHLTLRLFERPLFGLRRPVTPFITQAVCRLAFLVLGMRFRVRGKPMAARGAVVANHASWLDIFALNAPQRIYYVAKEEVARWPGIGWLARATGTVFIRRDPREAKAQQLIFEARLRAGHHLCFFPEGTSSDGVRVLPFKPTLFAAFYADGLNEILSIQPVTLAYHAPRGRDARFYGWFGDISFGGHLLQVLSQVRQGGVDVIFHEPLKIADSGGRKALARHCETVIRDGLRAALPMETLRD